MRSEFDHLEIFFTQAAFWVDLVYGYIGPQRARRNAVFRKTGFFVVDKAATETHPRLERLTTHGETLGKNKGLG